MNYNSVILVGIFFLIAVWWLIHGYENFREVQSLEIEID
jgi:hypothetical protein